MEILLYSDINIKRDFYLDAYTILIGFNYGLYAYFGYWTLISDPSPNKVVSKVENVDPKVPKQAEAKGDGVINPQILNYNLNQNFN